MKTELTFTETTKAIRAEIRKTFPGFKFSITGSFYSRIDIDILSGDIDFEGETSVNRFHLENSWKHNKKALSFLTKINDIVKKYHWDESDSMTDYFHCAFYYKISIGGGWDKPYLLKGN